MHQYVSTGSTLPCMETAPVHQLRTGSFRRASSLFFSMSVFNAAVHSTSQAALTKVSAERARSCTLHATNSAEMLMICNTNTIKLKGNSHDDACKSFIMHHAYDKHTIRSDVFTDSTS